MSSPVVSSKKDTEIGAQRTGKGVGRMPSSRDEDDRAGSKEDDDDRDSGKRDDAPRRQRRDAEDHEDSTSILDRVLELMLSSGMEHEFEDFAAKHIQSFSVAAEAKDEEALEYTLEHTEIFNMYLHKFEKKVSDFIEGEGFTVEEFFIQCNKIMARNDFEDPRKYFIEALLATTEFPIFVQLMITEARLHSLSEKQARLSLEAGGGGK